MYEHVFSILWDLLLGHIVTLPFKKRPVQFLEQLHHCTFPPEYMRIPFLHILARPYFPFSVFITMAS